MDGNFSVTVIEFVSESVNEAIVNGVLAEREKAGWEPIFATHAVDADYNNQMTIFFRRIKR